MTLSLGTLHNFHFWTFQEKKPCLVSGFTRCVTSYSTQVSFCSTKTHATTDYWQPRALVSNISNSTIRTSIYFSLYAFSCQEVQQRRIFPARLGIAISRGAQSFQKPRTHRQNCAPHTGDIQPVPYWRSTSMRPQLKNLWSRDSDSLRAGRSGDRIPVEARFPAPVQTGPDAHPASCTMGTGSFLGVKRPGRGVDHPTSSAEVKERVELYVYSPSGPSWSVLGQALPLPVT